MKTTSWFQQNLLSEDSFLYSSHDNNPSRLRDNHGLNKFRALLSRCSSCSFSSRRRTTDRVSTMSREQRVTNHPSRFWRVRTKHCWYISNLMPVHTWHRLGQVLNKLSETGPSPKVVLLPRERDNFEISGFSRNRGRIGLCQCKIMSTDYSSWQKSRTPTSCSSVPPNITYT